MPEIPTRLCKDNVKETVQERGLIQDLKSYALEYAAIDFPKNPTRPGQAIIEGDITGNVPSTGNRLLAYKRAISIFTSCSPAILT
ncbi:hypothetical protein J6590_015542 [Homalodisca vitripennis]|nr:hypothetical protein J6590_015542 [Homalodisca vitripennis]